ncbi:hypothetical protein [Pseudoalteromonas sp. SR43-3]|uniref:hypothetical protein n=1 Tax=Pseudoalteromonas sp. SR43-3 TaxID=2760943 RepID=UPI001601D869|nr:hypothetical protein [Pseudoalteromonas sp. SR43-3]MBB1277074.1 hypothetical protein [Pseudoalteromonas sp. SR43-3]
MSNNKDAMKAKFEEIKSSIWLKKENVRIITDENRNAEPEQELAFVLTFSEALKLYKKLKKEHYAVSISHTEKFRNLPAGWNLATHTSWTGKNTLKEVESNNFNVFIAAGISEEEAIELVSCENV